MRDAVISIKSKFADLILDGKKVFELRKSALPLNVSRFFIYSSGCDKKIVGSCFLRLDRNASELAREPGEYEDYDLYEFLHELRISFEEFCKYLEFGSKTPRVYAISDVVRFPEPLDLSHFGLTHAPQSWAYARCIPSSLMDGGN